MKYINTELEMGNALNYIDDALAKLAEATDIYVADAEAKALMLGEISKLQSLIGEVYHRVDEMKSAE